MGHAMPLKCPEYEYYSIETYYTLSSSTRIWTVSCIDVDIYCTSNQHAAMLLRLATVMISAPSHKHISLKHQFIWQMQLPFAKQKKPAAPAI